jgi:hypothetical protein
VINLEVLNCSTQSIVVGGESKIKFSDELWRRGMHRFALPSPPLLDSFEMSAPSNTAKLLYHSTVTGVASIDHVELNSVEMLWLHGEDRGGTRTIMWTRKS